MLKVFKNNDKLKATEIYYNETKSLLDILFPIGRGFIDFTDTDYSNYLGFVWEKELIGMTPIGKDTSQTEFNTIGKTGGAKTHKLTRGQLPNINGGFFLHSAGSATILHSVSGDFVTTNTNSNSYKAGGEQVNGAPSQGGFNLNFGNNEEHNNLQPYKVVNFWKRIS